jgi:uncharacterized protein (TIGR02145 family)
MKRLKYLKAIKIVFLAFILFAAGLSNAQIGIGIATPAPSAQLEVSSTTKGFLPPRMTNAQKEAIVLPAAGLSVWCNDCGVLGELQVYNGANWTNISGGYSAAPISPTVTIGTQIWMTKNLDVTTYRNGDPIPHVTDPAEWANLTTGAWCYYNNDPANGALYGKLYNRYAVVDPRGLAPVGWHVPDDGEWFALEDFLGGTNATAGKMRATTLWKNLGPGISNQSGYTGLPGGARAEDGSFFNIYIQGVWWSTSVWEPHKDRQWEVYNSAFILEENFDRFFIFAGHGISHAFEFPQRDPEFFPDPVQYGYSVRCVKD